MVASRSRSPPPVHCAWPAGLALDHEAGKPTMPLHQPPTMQPPKPKPLRRVGFQMNGGSRTDEIRFGCEVAFSGTHSMPYNIHQLSLLSCSKNCMVAQWPSFIFPLSPSLEGYRACDDGRTLARGSHSRKSTYNCERCGGICNSCARCGEHTPMIYWKGCLAGLLAPVPSTRVVNCFKPTRVCRGNRSGCSQLLGLGGCRYVVGGPDIIIQ